MGELKFTKSHEWVKIEGDTAAVGITDYAQKELGDIVYIELPKKGESIKQSAQFGTIESTKAASELYAPVTGKVIEINNELVNHPDWINESPFEKGWMIKIKIDNSTEISNLMGEAEYKKFVGKV